jgi:uncharacterized protein
LDERLEREIFEWDEAKSLTNLRDRGFDFEYASRIFAGDLLEREDRRRTYGEPRIVAYGEVDGRVLVVVYTWRGGQRRIISARPANRKERRDYRGAYPEGSP